MLKKSSHDNCILNTTQGSALAYVGETLVVTYGIIRFTYIKGRKYP